MASEYTPNYNLDKYVGTDKPNLRDQYNSAMDKIDAQFVVIENDHTETGNQISAINTNMTQLGERVTAAENKVTAVEGQIAATNATVAEVKETADNAMSLASTNEGDIATLDAEMVQVQQGVTNLQSATRSLVLLDVANKATGSQPFLSGAASQWDKGTDTTLNAAIPDWANFLDVTIQTTDSYWKKGASSYSDTEQFMAPVGAVTFPLNQYYIDSGTIKTRRVNKFSLYADSMGTKGDGMMTFGSSHVPFMINGNILTQKGMGLAKPADVGDSATPYSNGLLGCMYTFTPNNSTPTLSNIGSSFVIFKIVARA